LNYARVRWTASLASDRDVGRLWHAARSVGRGQPGRLTSLHRIAG